MSCRALCQGHDGTLMPANCRLPDPGSDIALVAKDPGQYNLRWNFLLRSLSTSRCVDRWKGAVLRAIIHVWICGICCLLGIVICQHSAGYARLSAACATAQGSLERP